MEQLPNIKQNNCYSVRHFALLQLNGRPKPAMDSDQNSDNDSDRIEFAKGFGFSVQETEIAGKTYWYYIDPLGKPGAFADTEQKAWETAISLAEELSTIQAQSRRDQIYLENKFGADPQDVDKLLKLLRQSSVDAEDKSKKDKGNE